ncbi:MAG TPA: nucleotidyltransferase domain-containing protein [Deltaproteobacteria bacterium]|nr:nucleotidyltransferase domain-containing protein [Deltaproteobacteria bacterium]
MAQSTALKAVRFLKKELEKSGLNVSRMILFGSRAGRHASKDSDIDVLIVSDDFRGCDIFERARLTKEGEIKTIRKFLIPLDIITATPDEVESGASLVFDFARNGRIV